MPDDHLPTLSRSTRRSGLVIISLVGDLDTAGTAAIEPAFRAALPDRTVNAVIDMAGVPFLTSRALAMLVVRAQAMHQAGGEMCLAGLTKIVSEVFDRAGFNNLFPIYPSLDDAIQARDSLRSRRPRRGSNRMDFS
jgi:anti-sigma B factor antagonist